MIWIALDNLDVIHLKKSLFLDIEMCSNNSNYDGEQFWKIETG